MDSACAEAIMTRFKGCAVCGGVTIRKSGRLVEVRGCRGHSDCAGRRGKYVWTKETVGTSCGERIWFLYSLDSEVLYNFVMKTQSWMIDTVD